MGTDDGVEEFRCVPVDGESFVQREGLHLEQEKCDADIVALWIVNHEDTTATVDLEVEINASDSSFQFNSLNCRVLPSSSGGMRWHCPITIPRKQGVPKVFNRNAAASGTLQATAKVSTGQELELSCV